jgi:rhamnosyltransferase
MISSDVCAVIVSFYPQPIVLENLATVRPQVGGLVVVDNGSPTRSLEPFRAAIRELRFTLIENGANLGIAVALNIGVRWAKSQGFTFVVFFDQDSTTAPRFIDAMTASYRDHPASERVGIVMPQYIDREYAVIRRPSHIAADGAPLEVMTSGSLVPVSLFGQCGGFREDFFIDQVDHEFGFRVRKQGYIVLLCEQALLFHAPGSPREHSFLGLMKFKTTHHNAMRRYYMTRNGIVMIGLYWNVHPAWTRGVARSLCLLPVRIILAETQKRAKLKNMLLGTFDALRGRLGAVDFR